MFGLTLGTGVISFLWNLLAAVIILIVGYIVISVIRGAVGRGLAKSKLDSTMHPFLIKCVSFVLWVFVILMVLQRMGVNTTSVVAVLGAAGVAVGLALQGALSNVAGGILILLNKPFKNGDEIEVTGAANATGVVDQIEGHVLFVEAGQTAGDLVVLSLGLGGDGHGVAGLGHFDGRQLLVQLGIAHGVAGFPIHLAHGHDVAAAGVLDLHGLLAGDGVQTAQLIGAGGAQVTQGHVGADAAAHDLDDAVLAELVGNGLEHEGLGGAGGLDALYLGGAGNVVHNALQQGIGADVLHGGAGEDGDHAPILQTGLDARDHIGLVQLHGLEELLHQLLGGARGGLHQLHAQLFHAAGVGGGNGALAGLAALGEVGHVVHQVDDAAAVGAGDGHRGHDAAVLGAQGLHHGEVVAVLLVALGHHKQGGQLGGLQVFPGTLGAHGDAVLGGDQDGAGFHGPQGAEHFAHKVKVTRAVQHVDLRPTEVHRRETGGNGDLALDLFGVVVADGVAVADLAQTVGAAGDEEHALGKAGLAAVAVAQKADVANVFGFHVLLPLYQVS